MLRYGWVSMDRFRWVTLLRYGWVSMDRFRWVTLDRYRWVSMGRYIQLEPSCGIGRFLHYFSPATPVTACEPDEISAAIAKANFPGYNIKKQTFNELFTDRSGKLKPIKAEYHLIIGNPPYGAFTGRLTAQEKQRTGSATYPEYFVRRSADLLLPGGLIVFIIPSAWIDSNQDVPGLELLEAYRMPISTFGGQTDVATDIVVYRKK